MTTFTQHGSEVTCDQCGARYDYGDEHEHVCPFDAVDHPPHYNKHPSGVECIDIIEHMDFCLGNAIKYIWRADLKGKAIEDLEKARWYIDREIERRTR
jgi:hypothetical protein